MFLPNGSPINSAQLVGFEPTLPEGIWFLVRRLNRSATTAHLHVPSLDSKIIIPSRMYDT